jgi:putative flippase GtrA
MRQGMMAKLARYAVVGLVTLAVYLITGRLAQGLEIAMVWQASLAFTAAVTVNFLLQRAWVFADSRPAASSLPRYAVMISVGYVINYLALASLSPHLPLIMAQLFAVCLVVISNAVLAFSWVFLVVAPRKTNTELRGDLKNLRS